MLKYRIKSLKMIHNKMKSNAEYRSSMVTLVENFLPKELLGFSKTVMGNPIKEK